MINEKVMEDLIASNPEFYLGEPGLRLVGRQFVVAGYRFDLIFCDRTGAKIIVEIQKGTLDRSHTYKILDYYDAFKEQHPHEFVEVMVVANVIPAERKQRLASMGIAYREIPTAEFLAKLGPGAEATPAQTQPEASKFPVTGQNPPVQSEVRGERPQSAFALFKDQQARLSIALRDCDPTLWFPPLRGNFEPDAPGNWFICFVPGAWGRWRSRNYGVHFDFAYARARRDLPERFRLVVGVESPMKPAFRQAFKEAVISQVKEKGISQSAFVLQSKERTKLLEADPIPFNDKAWEVALGRYRSIQPVTSIIANVVKEYWTKEAFDTAMEF